MAATKLGSRNCYSGEKNVRTHLHLWHIPLRYRKAGRPRAVLHRNKSINNYAAKHSQKAAHSSTFLFFLRRFLDKRGLCTTRGNSVSTISPGTLVGKKGKQCRVQTHVLCLCSWVCKCNFFECSHPQTGLSKSKQDVGVHPGQVHEFSLAGVFFTCQK